MMPELQVDPEVKAKYPGITIGVGVVFAAGSAVKNELLEEEIGFVSRTLREEHSLEALKDEANCRAYRDFYWRMGVDPTKQRPAAEALARRILRGDSLPRISPIVDAYNLASLRTLVAIGAYDLARVEGGLKLRLSSGGELFEPIGGGSETLQEGQIVLADEHQIMHVYPYRDSRLTSVSQQTHEVLVLSAGVPGVSRVFEAVGVACESIVRLCGGRVEAVRLVE